MVIIFENKARRDEHPLGGPTMKEQYGKDWDKIEKEIRKDPENFKIWGMYVGPDPRMFHNLRSHSRKGDEIVFPQNDWLAVEYSTPPYRWVGRTSYTPDQGTPPVDQFIEDVKFLLKYRKRDLKISLKDPEKDEKLKGMQHVNKRMLINGFNPFTNANALKKQDIVDAINDTFDVEYKYRDHTKDEFIDLWVDLNEKELEKELKN